MSVPHRRGLIATVTAGLAVLALTAGAGLAAPAEAAPARPAEAAPAQRTDAAPHAKSRGAGARNLPTEATMAWLEAGDWRSEGTTSGPEPDSTSPCTTRSLTDYRGAKAKAWERSFILRATGSDWARAVLVQFDTAKHASAAERAVTRELQHCDDTLAGDASYVSVGQPAPTRRVPTKVGSARFTETSYVTSTDVEIDPNSSTFEATGTVRFGRRLLVLTMTTHGQDDNWSHVANDPTELPLHPMYRTLPAAAKRLSR